MRGEKIGRAARNIIDSTAGLLFLFLVTNVLISDAGLGRITPAAFLLTLAVTQLVFAGTEAAIAQQDAIDTTATSSSKARGGRGGETGRGGNKAGKGRDEGGPGSDKSGRGSFFGARAQPGRGASSAAPARGRRTRGESSAEGGGETMLQRLTRRLASGTRSSVQDRPGGEARRRPRR